MLPGICAAQNQQFLNLPQVQLTSGRVSSFLTGVLQTNSPGGTDIFYINAPTGSGTTTSVTAGALLSHSGGGFLNQNQNRITFTNVSNVVAALADFTGDNDLDVAFALSPTVAGTTDLCVYYGTGVDYNQAVGGASSYAGAVGTPNAYPPTGGKNGCMTFSVQGSNLPNFSQIVAFPFTVGSSVQELMIEDSANNLLYIFQGNGAPGTGGALGGFTLINAIHLPAADGAGPIYIGDFNGDGNTDFIVNGQTGYSASVYFGNGNGTFQAPVRYVFDLNVHSMLLHDMNGDGIQDMVVEGNGGKIEIFPGTGTTANPFSTTSIGGTPNTPMGNPPPPLLGFGGHLAAIDPNTLNILATTPIGLSDLVNAGGLQYSVLAGLYNIGPGRSSFALADFYGNGNLDLAVDSPEGVAIIPGFPVGTGGFVSSYGYTALAPALGATIGRFRNAAHNPNGLLDVAVATGAVQGQLLTALISPSNFFVPFGNSTSPEPTNTSGGPSGLPANLWSNIVSGDFNGDGNLDIAYSLTGLPLPTPSVGAGPGLYVQYGNGDGTFQNPVAVSSSSANAPAANTFYGESTVGDFNGDSVADIANIDAGFDDTLLGQRSGNPFTAALNQTSSNTAFNQVAAGFFKTGRTSQQDLIFQQGASFIPYVNKQDGTGRNFTAKPALTGAGGPLYPSTVLLADVDGDGNGDLVVAYYNANFNSIGAGPVAPNNVYIWWGNGDGTFNQTPLVLDLSRNYYLGQVADMNGDGLPDLVLSDGSLVSIIYNQGSRSFGTVNPNTGLYASEQHFLAGQGINSLSLVNLSAGSLPSLIAANGGATISNALALGGGTASSISLPANPDVNTGGITVLINDITTLPVTGTLVASPEPSNVGATFTLTATITPVSGSTAPAGSVTFSIDGSTASCPVATLAPGGGASLSSTATCVIPAGNTYASGVHPISAIYSGSSVYSSIPLSGAAGTHKILGNTTPLMVESLAATPEPSAFGAGFTLIATLTPSPGVAVPTGVVTFFIDGVQVGTGNLAPVAGSTSSSASFPIPVGNVYAVGSHALSASYSGDSANSPATFLGTHIIAGTTTTTIFLCVSPNPGCPYLGAVPTTPPYASSLTMYYGQGWNGTWQVTASDGGAVPGNFELFDVYNGVSGPPLCNVPNTGPACPPAVGTTVGTSVGVNVVTGAYTGDTTHTGSTSLPVTITVLQDTTTATLTSSLNPAPAGQPVTFTATLTGNYAAPTGPVTFAETFPPTTVSLLLGTANLVPGPGLSSTATFTTSSLPVGTDPIVAGYQATTDFGLASASLNQVITPSLAGNFTITVTPNPVSAGVGLGVVLGVTVTPQNGFTQGVNLTCSNLPNEASCIFVNPAIPAGGGGTTLIVETTAPHTCGTTAPYFYGGMGKGPLAAPFALPALAGLVLLIVPGRAPGRRRWLRALVAVTVVAAIMQISGCGTCTDLGTRPATYTFQVIGTAANSSTTTTQTVTLTVTI
ncbi:MAG: FG-GAP-like repeat-containing protein [Acidobacteriaceae bacterium]|jgi:hypothetical protein